MSDLTTPAEEAAIPHNEYFEGKVQSLGLLTGKGKATVGVMKKGNYRFSASAPEKMVIVAGEASVNYQDTDHTYTAGHSFDVAAGTAFDITCEGDVAYICYYG
jgi:uncharacterized protein YaiE (UPF0345 family)